MHQLIDMIFQVLTAENAKIFGGFVGAILVVVSRDLIHWWKASKKKKNKYRITVEKDNRIEQIIVELRLALKADRVVVMQFHNGENFFTGSSIQRVSVTHECEAPGTSRVADVFQSKPISLEAPVIDMILRDYPAMVDVNKMQDSFKRGWLESIGVNFWIAHAIRANHQIIGYAVLHWMSEDFTLTIEEVERIRLACEQISSQLIL